MAYVVQAIEEDDEETKEPYLKDLQGMLDEYAGVFNTPKWLPPFRECDHMIPLINPHISVNSRPYRYPFYQKNEIDKSRKCWMQESSEIAPVLFFPR